MIKPEALKYKYKNYNNLERGDRIKYVKKILKIDKNVIFRGFIDILIIATLILFIILNIGWGCVIFTILSIVALLDLLEVVTNYKTFKGEYEYCEGEFIGYKDGNGEISYILDYETHLVTEVKLPKYSKNA